MIAGSEGQGVKARAKSSPVISLHSGSPLSDSLFLNSTATAEVRKKGLNGRKVQGCSIRLCETNSFLEDQLYKHHEIW